MGKGKQSGIEARELGSDDNDRNQIKERIGRYVYSFRTIVESRNKK